MLMAFLPLISIFFTYVDDDIHDRKTDSSKIKKLLAVSVIGFITLPIFWTIDGDQRKMEIEKADMEWKRNGCLVYKSECGSKRKYECEVKTNIAGRVDIGDIIVQSYPTCRPS